MQNLNLRTIFDVVTDFLASEPSAEEILKYHFPADLQARVDELVERNGEGQLTFDEQEELFDFLRADEMIALLKAKTKLRLKGKAQKFRFSAKVIRSDCIFPRPLRYFNIGVK